MSVAVVTGASAGIGKALVLKLAEKGFNVAFCARRQERLDELKSEVLKINQDLKVLAKVVDLKEEKEILEFFEDIKTTFDSRIDVLVNNAGLGHPAPLIDDDRSTTAQWKEMFDVNVIALSICTREAIQLMKKRNSGHVVHVSSMSAHRVKGSGMYAATKHAVRALTERLRQELREIDSDIRVSSISPGWVETEFVTQYYQGDEEKAQGVYGRYKCLESEDIADAIMYTICAPPHVQIHDILLRPLRQKE
mmetsp:Transcript_11378/g.19032  ORF Transcript_11378/g.19032 Transcript_11378/m.19032 type:complete len:250 (+) Transcript_11378:35-784(+)